MQKALAILSRSLPPGEDQLTYVSEMIGMLRAMLSGTAAPLPNTPSPAYEVQGGGVDWSSQSVGELETVRGGSIRGRGSRMTWCKSPWPSRPRRRGRWDNSGG
jgi:hypothetical protein